ncbi:hypothetical protein ACFX13_041220 [Malus domestica]
MSSKPEDGSCGIDDYDADYDGAELLLRISILGEEGFGLGTFAELFNKLPLAQQHHFVAEVIKQLNQEIKDHINDQSSESSDCFAQLFLDFSLIWFKGQAAPGQRHLVRELYMMNGFKRVKIDHRKIPEESEKDLNLRKFRERFKQLEFRDQVRFIYDVEEELLDQRTSIPRWMCLLGPQQDSAGAAELLSRLSNLAFGLLSANDRSETVGKMSRKFPEGTLVIERHVEESEENFRMRTFMDLFNKVPVFKRLPLFQECFDKKFSGERSLCELLFFSGNSTPMINER